MIKAQNVIKALPEMIAGEELVSALTILPEYDECIRNESQAVRLVALSDLYRIYLPSQMSLEIYSKLYLALLRSLQKKGTIQAVQQRNENSKAIRQQSHSGIIGGSDSFTIIGCSGIGKSSAISRAVSLISGDGVIETEKPCSQIIPCLTVQCPFDSSVKGLLLEILRKVDESIGSSYYQNAVTNRSTTDMLIGCVSQVLLNHIGLLIVDEIQNVVNSKNGRVLIGSLTQLLNGSGISVCMVGTPESEVFFEQAMHLARRSLGLQYNRLEYDRYFQDFCRTLFQYQYIKQPAEFTPAVTEWLYEHSGGVVSVVVSLLHDAQEIAILDGSEELNIASLEEAYRKRLLMLHGYIQSEKKSPAPRKSKKQDELPLPAETQQETESSYNISSLVKESKSTGVDMVTLLKQHMPVVEVRV